MVLGVLGIIAAFIVAVFVIRNATSQSLKASPANAAVVQLLTGVKQSTWETVGTGGLANPFTTKTGQPALTGPHGHPEFLYIGGEYCPNCAAERWAMINALSRFGSFKNLSQIVSVETGANVSTFTFVGSSYTSQYVDFVPREILGNSVDSSGNYVSLDKLTSSEQSLFAKYDSQGYFPFIDVGNTYIMTAASYSYAVLLDGSGNTVDWQTIADSLTNTNSSITQGILGSANYMTAAICSLTNQQPGSVCNSSVIQQIEHTLNTITASDATSSSPLAIAPADFTATRRRVLG